MSLAYLVGWIIGKLFVISSWLGVTIEIYFTPPSPENPDLTKVGFKTRKGESSYGIVLFRHKYLIIGRDETFVYW